MRDAVLEWTVKHGRAQEAWSLPVVAETWDGYLNDLNGFHVRPEHVFAALDSATSGRIAEGNVGGGTGMHSFEFKGGTGTSSRRVRVKDIADYTVGALVQSNFGMRKSLVIAGVPVGQEISDWMPIFHYPDPAPGSGSIIAIVGTNAPLVAHQCKRLAKRIPLGIARLGGVGAVNSGDIFMAFSTANPGAAL